MDRPAATRQGRFVFMDHVWRDVGRGDGLVEENAGLGALFASRRNREDQSGRGCCVGFRVARGGLGNVAASAIAGLLYTFASPAVPFIYLAAWMLVALVLLAWSARTRTAPAASTE